MNTVFIGGSRHVSRLNAQVKERLNNVITSGHRVVVATPTARTRRCRKANPSSGQDARRAASLPDHRQTLDVRVLYV